jgi:protein ImuA
MEQREQTFPAAQMLRSAGSCQDSWSPDLKEQPTKNEIFCRLDDAAGVGFALALAAQSGAGKPWLWVQDKQSRRRSGMPHIHGLPQSIRNNLHYIAAQTCEDALFAMEEGLRCAGLSFVIGELAGDPKALGFTASRRLAVASEAHGVPLYLLRGDASRQLSAARMRWDVAAAPSSPHRWDNRAPGAPQAQAELFRTRLYRPGRWWLTHENGKLTATNIKGTPTDVPAGIPATSPANRVDLVALTGDQPMAASGRC